LSVHRLFLDYVFKVVNTYYFFSNQKPNQLLCFLFRVKLDQIFISFSLHIFILFKIQFTLSWYSYLTTETKQANKHIKQWVAKAK